MNYETHKCGRGVKSGKEFIKFCDKIASNFYKLESDWMIGYYSEIKGYISLCKEHRLEIEAIINRARPDVTRVNKEEYESALLVES